MNPSRPLQALHRGSRFLAWCCMLVAIVWPVVSLGYVMLGSEADLFSTFGVPPPVGAVVVLKGGQRLVIAILNLIPILAAGIGLWALCSCFRQFSTGEFFSVRTVGLLRRFSGWTFCYTALSMIFQPLTMAAITFHFPAGQHFALISFGPQQLHALLLAGTVWVISGAMAEAGRLADENAQFV